MKDTKYKILAYFDNQSYRKLFNEVNSDYAENLQILLHNLSLFSYDVLIIGVIVYKENISNIISAIRKITQIPIIILTDASSLLCMSWKKELIYAGADCVMDINSTIEEVDLQIFSLARRNNKQKITQKQSETMIDKGKLVMDHKKHKVFWNNVALHLTRQPESVEALLDTVENEELLQILLSTDKKTLQMIVLKMMGYAPKEISHHMELPEQTVYTRLRRLREKIKKSMKFE